MQSCAQGGEGGCGSGGRGVWGGGFGGCSGIPAGFRAWSLELEFRVPNP